MKKYISIITLAVANMAFSQVIINADVTTSKTSPSSSSALLEFGNDGNKGIILPYVETLPTGANNAKGGTLIFDVSTNTEYKVKVKNENTGWTDLSGQSGFSTAVETIVKPPQAAPLEDKADAKAIIGNQNTATNGVLVLESSNKAMILPITDDFTKIKNPSPGMMAFVKHPTDNTKHRLIIFNGQKWSFWEAN